MARATGNTKVSFECSFSVGRYQSSPQLVAEVRRANACLEIPRACRRLLRRLQRLLAAREWPRLRLLWSFRRCPTRPRRLALSALLAVELREVTPPGQAGRAFGRVTEGHGAGVEAQRAAAGRSG